MLYLTAQTARVATLLLAAALVGCASATTKAPEASNGTRAMATPPVLPQPQGPVPLREPALVMRVWVAPWEGANGDLNAPGYVYTEIAPAALDHRRTGRSRCGARHHAPADRGAGSTRTPGTERDAWRAGRALRRGAAGVLQ